jgi:predicted trehalose synthase
MLTHPCRPIAGSTALPAGFAHPHARLTELRDSPALPDQPDRAWVDDWLHRSYLDSWAQRH